jgi:hypothetical protein
MLTAMSRALLRTATTTGLVALALLLAPVSFASAQEMGGHGGGMEVTSCVGGFTSGNCVRRWQWYEGPNHTAVARDAQNDAAARERFGKWEARCKPVIKQDQYGVGRYHYAAAGCEFGRYED